MDSTFHQLILRKQTKQLQKQIKKPIKKSKNKQNKQITRMEKEKLLYEAF